MKAETIELDSSHRSIVTHLQWIAGLILEAAGVPGSRIFLQLPSTA